MYWKKKKQLSTAQAIIFDQIIVQFVDKPVKSIHLSVIRGIPLHSYWLPLPWY